MVQYSKTKFHKEKASEHAFFLSPLHDDVLLLVLLFGTVLQDPREFDIIEESALDWRLPVHFVDVLNCVFQ